MSSSTEVEIDDSLYSRQRYVLGDGAMEKMAVSNVLVSGLGGLGVELAKNVVLAGVKSITLHDTRTASISDLGSQFYLREEDIKKERNRAEASCSKLAELNPYVEVRVFTKPLEENLDFLKEFQCVVLTEASMKQALVVDKFCRSQNPPIKFIASDVLGLFSYTFCDFGDEFEVVDRTGEEPKEFFISDISKANPGVLLTLDNQMHGLEDGDKIEFKEIVGMTALNGTTQTVKVESPYAVSICDTSSDEFQPYQYGGIARQVKTSRLNHFDSLEDQLKEPNILLVDLCKMEAAPQLHLAMRALDTFKDNHGHLPNVRDSQNAEELVKIAAKINEQQMKTKVDKIDEDLLTVLSYSSRGLLPPLAAAVGGFVAQEVLKALTGKFTPLKQWLYLDAIELAKETSDKSGNFLPKNDRYDSLRICVGEELLQKLKNVQLFMVGCGAIGCEMLKNYAMVGIGTGKEGKITITDNDLIEKSNLNRQFLFRPRDIQKSKSLTASKAILEINPDIEIDPHQHKVAPETEEVIYTDEFFRSKNIVVNALDNVEARRYVDSRCVTNQVPLLESGTMGPKGHIQCVVPHLTESYSSQRDPEDGDVPYCTLKSFPAVIDHTIQWARNKFESCYSQKPQLYNKFWSSNKSVSDLVQSLENGQKPDGIIVVVKSLKSWPKNWRDCVARARLQFEKYYNHKAKQLLHLFPRDTRLSDGTLFWQSPKRPPTAIEFDVHNELHYSFLESASRLHANVHNIHFTPEDLTKEALIQILRDVKVPEFVPSNKTVEVEENQEKSTEKVEDEDVLLEACKFLTNFLKSQCFDKAMMALSPLEFEKDDDSNGHIDYIAACSNLRATMYNIENADRFKTKKIAGRIVPAIATTTAAVSGLVTIELIKVIKGSSFDDYRNCFLNLALPVFVFSQPAPATRTVIREGLSFTLWDRWEVLGKKTFTLKDFIKHFKEKYNFETTLVSVGVKVLYMPILPGHMKRLKQTMVKLVNPAPESKYVDLIVSFTEDGRSDEDDDLPAPPVRYYFGN
ncbi:ubiquitin-like modifier-activating enzyme 6 [Dendronephthya gigantea]|uniref:ubiquitin-like modifier-activating enzyme 6 n=1 Tax=Dendronephthya gigantea TaxID=151771 RepID=UPI00106AAF52|nr:ubiquitin-like modifier-activating enzyme 6 [Dendronephthya gigantea]XP_028399060.1 ubiquitin-like modifier-activating enzyme 6 [Dendronephthya gigantea]